MLERQLMNYRKCVNCLPQGNLSMSATNLPVKKKKKDKKKTKLAKAQSWRISFLLVASTDGNLDVL